MNHYPFPENRITKGAGYLFLFLVLYLSRNTLVTSSILGFYKAQFLMLGLFLALGAGFLWYRRGEWKAIFTDKRVAAFGICALIVLLPMVLKRDWQMMYFTMLIAMGCAVLLTYFLRSREVAKTFVVIMTALSLYSVLATYVLRKLPDMGWLNVPVFYNQAGVDFYNFFFGFVSKGYLSHRNFGIFREPGVYQYFLVLALYLAHYHTDWKKPFWLWFATAVMAVTMVTTLATGGILAVGLLAVVVFFDKKLYRNKWVLALAILAVIVIVYVLEESFRRKNNQLYINLIDKFVRRTDSVTERVEAIGVNLRLFLSSPLLGAKLSDVLHGVEHNTISTPILFAIYGVVGGCFHVAGWLALIWKKEQKLWVNLALCVILFICFNTQNMTADVFFWLFPTMALTERVLPCLRLPERKG